ncbi:fumarylacetoacetate hydrolase family protein [Wenxinia marina]|uniref:2-keto-4-pentenoate hydratase/2-oxohepta-3-ene-1,7-dioic acid hydratase (Catechol pathway) n=1 Tax=Wenxinia marina DSM 24838 TaxID=1123501 RepID=A0A0D0PF77_9RHOB|nr:fumarylacetoacetate hydrolase family protein [Wenxinia marina]KIQ70021.1 2-keto-4-pentenoate hydratase/2-oxohepta-3-ene-1,7-dioic acid hydratase (catechol pathway) [Wenxinia marina DSM 24838]GGL62907.1 fumarylpyruvate hydrolase [Wenxinia marina]
MSFVLPPPPVPSLAVAGRDERFAVRRIWCVGRNYAEHAREMGHDPEREPPFFFAKPADALVEDGATVPYPPATADLHYEGELVVAIGRAGRDIDEADALSHVWGYAAGNDLTRRDLQSEAKALRRPWALAKGFDLSAPVGALVPAEEIGHPATGMLRLTVNGAVRQEADIAEMIWPVPGILAHLSRLVELQPGDLIMTGTPAGVGALKRGDVCRVEIDGVGAVETAIEA